MKDRRRGYALVELLVVITVTTIMLTLAAGLIHVLLKLDRSGRSASEQAADMARLARDFRLDVHASDADGVEATALPNDLGSDRVRIRVGEKATVEYEVRPDDLLRTVREGPKVRHYEIYRRPPRAKVRFWVDGSGPRPFALLQIDRPTDNRDDSLYRDYSIEAEIGKNLRLNPRAE